MTEQEAKNIIHKILNEALETERMEMARCLPHPCDSQRYEDGRLAQEIMDNVWQPEK